MKLNFSCRCSPRNLFSQLTRVADIPSCRRLRSSATDALLVNSTRLVTVGDRAFPVAAAKPWNKLPGAVTAVVTPIAFRRQLKTFLFRVSIRIDNLRAFRNSSFALTITYVYFTKKRKFSNSRTKIPFSYTVPSLL